MKIAPALWHEHRKTAKIRPLAEAALWLAVVGLLILALRGPGQPAPARAAAQAPRATRVDQSARFFNGACLKHVLDSSVGRTEEQVVAELTQRCFIYKPRTPAVAPKAPTCANAFTWGPALAASPRTGPCFRQSRAGLPPGWSPPAAVPFPSVPSSGSRPRWG